MRKLSPAPGSSEAEDRSSADDSSRCCWRRWWWPRDLGRELDAFDDAVDEAESDRSRRAALLEPDEPRTKLVNAALGDGATGGGGD